MKNSIQQDRLKVIYSKMRIDSPSMGFENNLMLRIRKEHQLAECRRARIALVAMLVGVFAIVLAPLLVFYLLDWPIAGVFSDARANLVSMATSIKISPLMLSVSLVCLFLLLLDSMVRRHIYKKENK